MPKILETKSTLVKAIFTNLLFVLGVILMVIGFVQGSLTVAKLLLFDVYPLPAYEESRCDLPLYKEAVVGPEVRPAQPQVIDPDQAAKCAKELERDRKVKQAEDAVGATSFLIAGLALTTAFKKFIFDRQE